MIPHLIACSRLLQSRQKCIFVPVKCFIFFFSFSIRSNARESGLFTIEFVLGNYNDYQHVSVTMTTNGSLKLVGMEKRNAAINPIITIEMTFWLYVCVCVVGRPRGVNPKSDFFFVLVLCVWLRFNATRIVTILWSNDCIAQNIQHAAACGHSSNGGGGHTPKIFITFLNIIFYYLSGCHECIFMRLCYKWLYVNVHVSWRWVFFFLCSLLSFDYIKKTKEFWIVCTGSRGANDKEDRKR